MTVEKYRVFVDDLFYIWEAESEEDAINQMKELIIKNINILHFIAWKE